MIVGTRTRLAQTIAELLELPETRVTAYRPIPMEPPAVWVEAVSLDAGRPNQTVCAPSMEVQILAVAEGEAETQRLTLDEWIETLWRGLPAAGFALISAAPDTDDGAITQPAYRIILNAWIT